MQTLLQNLRFSLRMLARNPGMTITVLLTLALGIGANTAIFTVDYATLLAPLPYPEPNQSAKEVFTTSPPNLAAASISPK